jgi:NADPH:quinone reductase-like Zn-dependent oxidoreductase
MTTTKASPTRTRAASRSATAHSVPATMKAAAIDRFGPPDVLKLHTLPVPKPGPREVLIELYAAGVGIWEAKIRDGTWASGKERFPLVLGADGAGIVVARGGRVRTLRIGEPRLGIRVPKSEGRVLCRVHGGSCRSRGAEAEEPGSPTRRRRRGDGLDCATGC